MELITEMLKKEIEGPKSPYSLGEVDHVENTCMKLITRSEYCDWMEHGYCQECQMDFTLLKTHTTLFHGDTNEIRCAICGELFWKKLKLLKHLHKHEGTDIKCRYCDATSFTDFEELFLHLEEHEFLHIYVCKLCPMTFAVKSNFEDHVSAHSSSWKRALLECLECEIRFEATRAGMRKLRKHWEMHHEGNLKCAQCRKSFTKFIVFYNHCMRHKRDLPFACDECGLMFRKNCRLKEHIQSKHLNMHAYVCQYCNEEFKHKPSFDAHIRSHDESLRFACNYCAKLFLRKISLIDHFVERSCGICDQEFHCRLTFDRHFETMHRQDRMFVCDKCDRSYIFENGLKRHNTLNHPVKKQHSFKCSSCLYETTTRHNLNRHIRRNHAN